MNQGQVIIHLIVPGGISRERATLILTKPEIERASRFRFENDASHWIACRAHLRLILGKELSISPQEVPLVLSEYGKPVLASPHSALFFNLSHSKDLALLALSIDGPVGVDLENNDRGSDLLGCESTFCHSQEIIELPNDPQLRAAHLLRIWTHKEALLKALGTGLSHPPEQVRICFDQPFSTAVSDRRLEGIAGQHLQNLSHPLLKEYQAAISMPTTVRSVAFDSGVLGNC
jgi:4'-phosphopantetheinyl transferase